MSSTSSVSSYCICMVKNPRRVENVRKMREILPDLQVIEAIDGKALEKTDIDAFVEEGFLVPNAKYEFKDKYVFNVDRDISIGELGIFLSHRKALERVRDQEAQYGVIFEDDVILHPDFERKMGEAIRCMESNAIEFDVLLMYVFENQKFIFEHLNNVPHIVPTPKGLWGLQAYVVPKNRASAVLEKLWPMEGAADEQITRVGLKHYTCVNMDMVKTDDTMVSANAHLTIVDHVNKRDSIDAVYAARMSETGRVFDRLNEIMLQNHGGMPVEGCVWFEGGSNVSKTPRFEHKRRNLFKLAASAREILEIGFNAGHSAALMLLANPHSHITIFDLAEHPYTIPCLEYLIEEFPGRIRKAILGDSRVTLPKFVRSADGQKFDVIHIDGGHAENVLSSDFEWCSQLADHARGHKVVVDDDDYPVIHAFNRKMMAEGRVRGPLEDGFASYQGKMFHFIGEYIP